MDEGKSFDPNTYSEPDLMQRIKEKKRGGMGVYLIRKLMDQVQYNRKGETNEIRMVKKL
jgi:serine/threonine-protein kinase RsbW